MDNRELYRRVRQLVRYELEFFVASSSSAKLWQAQGIRASIVPAAPDRSMFNWCLSDSLERLQCYYDQIAATYDQAGVRAWTVWMDPGTMDVGAFLEPRGHRLDAEPTAMAAPIAELVLPDEDGLEWRVDEDVKTIGRINDAAFGFPPPAFAAVMARPVDGWRFYIASLGGRSVASVMTFLSADGDCGVTGVAALPETRGTRVGTRLLGCALRDAIDRGATTASLQATSKGAPVYAAMGFRNLGRMGMWEKRRIALN